MPTIGLEIHAELRTTTKMFCHSRNDAYSAEANTNVCPVCLAHPGTLPVINREAVRHVLRVGLALRGTLADYTEFDRKNYFYPDQPKGYQLSQYEYPLVSGGELHGVAVTRVHLEEDTASSSHEEGVGTVIDYNRSGVPLMELVTEPIITSSKQAGDFARELQLLLKYLCASDANMEKGEMRVEANISISKNNVRGTKVEVKNLNSFRAMERAIEFEIKRQASILERGEVVVQETRGWDEGKQSTFSQRAKEGSADYRYFPDPDLPSLRLSEIKEYLPSSLAKDMPELPFERRRRYLDIGIKYQDAESFVRSKDLGDFFETVIANHVEDRDWVILASNYVANDLVALIRDTEKPDTESNAEIAISARNFNTIIDMLATRKVSSSVAKQLLIQCFKTKKDPEMLANDKNLLQSGSPDDLKTLIEVILLENASVVSDYRSGKAPALQFLIGKAMKTSKGTADPSSVKALLLQMIDLV